MKKEIRYIMTALAICLMSSCIDKYDADLPSSDTKLIYVEGDIKSEQLCTFTLSYTTALDGYKTEYVLISDISVVGDDGTRFETTSCTPTWGFATIEVGTLNPNTKYHLEATIVKDESYVTLTSAEQYPTEKNDIVDFKYYQREDDLEVGILVSTDARDEGQYFKWEYSEDWEIHTIYTCWQEYNPETDEIEQLKKPKHIGWKSAHQKTLLIGNSNYTSGHGLTDYKVHGISSNDDRLSERYRIKVRQYTISKEHYEYEQARLQLSEQMGGLFTPQPSEYPTNITLSDDSRALGYVDVIGGYDEKELYINRYEIEYTPIRNNVQYPTKKDLASLTDKQLYDAGYQLIRYDMSAIEWASIWSVDVTALGASLIKPKDWKADGE